MRATASRESFSSQLIARFPLKAEIAVLPSYDRGELPKNLRWPKVTGNERRVFRRNLSP